MRRLVRLCLAVSGVVSFTVWPRCMSAAACGRSAWCGAVATPRPSRHFSMPNTAYRPQSRSSLTELREVSMDDPNERVKGPGIKYRKRKTGPPVPYWFADEKAIKAGYPSKSSNLSTFADRPALLIERAERL